MNRAARILFIVLLLATALGAQQVSPASSPKSPTTIQLTEDAVTFFKSAVVVAGIFVGALAFIGVAFFGFDVRKARSALDKAQSEIAKDLAEAQKLLVEIREMHRGLSDMKRRFDDSIKDAEQKIEQIGTQIEAIAEPEPTSQTTAQIPQTPGRSDAELIREVIANSNFEWTSIKRITNKTGFDRDKILQIVRSTPGIEMSLGSKTKDHIFRLTPRSPYDGI